MVSRRIIRKHRSGGIHLEPSRVIRAAEAPEETPVSATGAGIAYGHAMPPSHIQFTPPPPPRVFALPNGRLAMTARCSVPALIRWAVRARAATGTSPTGLQASAAPDSPALTWPDGTVTHHSIPPRNPALDAPRLFLANEGNAGPGASLTGACRWSGNARAGTPVEPDPTLTPTRASTPAQRPEPTPLNPPPASLAPAARVPGSAVPGGPAQQSTPPPRLLAPASGR